MPVANTPESTSTLESDLSKLAALLADSNNTEANEQDIAALLLKLEAANGIAEGVEGKLDGIIDHLDGLLSSLETDVKAGE